MKYELVKDDTIQVNGHTLHRIRCTNSFQNPAVCVKKGDFGGYVEDYTNLCQNDTSWIGADGKVYENGYVGYNALVRNATVRGTARVVDNAQVMDGATIQGDAYVTNYAIIKGHVTIECNIGGHAYITQTSDFCYFNCLLHVSAYKTVEGNVEVTEAFFHGSLEDYRRRYESCSRRLRKACKHVRKLIKLTLVS